MGTGKLKNHFLKNLSKNVFENFPHNYGPNDTAENQFGLGSDTGLKVRESRLMLYMGICYVHVYRQHLLLFICTANTARVCLTSIQSVSNSRQIPFFLKFDVLLQASFT